MKERLTTIPGLVDAHVHLRDPGLTHKEDFWTGTCAALVGGVVTVLDMPNNLSPVVNPERLSEKRRIAKEKAVCDYGFYFGADRENFTKHQEIINEVCGLKIYLDVTTGSLLVDNLFTLMRHFQSWPGGKPICVHAEDLSVAKVLGLAAIYRKHVHFCHVTQKSEIQLIKKAKEVGLPVTCEVTPHHLFLTEEDEKSLGPFGKMKPPLRTAEDVDAIWRNLDVVDVVASDHAPHTKDEKLSKNPPFGVPGLETTLPLLLTAVSQNKLSLERLVELVSINPARIFGIKQDKTSYVEVDLHESYVIKNSDLRTKCGWSPFEGKRVTGRIRRVFLRGQKIYENGEILVKPGFGKEVNP